MVFKCKDNHTPIILSLMKDRKCLWNTITVSSLTTALDSILVD
jgi:hypothetical protein